MKHEPSHYPLVDDNQLNALDLDHETTRQRHQGQAWKYNYPRHIRQDPANLYRQYGSIKNHTSSIPILENQPIPRQKAPVCSVFVASSSEVSLNEVTKIHLGNIYRNLENRLRIAKVKGDEFLISLLEKESQDLSQMCVDYS
ncbi:hypothetical protein VB715_02215 [Crocosphaera sp. UHCC 0190]|uniref:hypothetical protein n=1 Tax=Crocosphaera sp. UHCC 0190 TaxID=3110246 RepID=UPI002B217FEE|nr:hypothetical protein [Crocosphaera sp. UHCC 0190]MEA5508570.1 hypothetical protein [Crocosphaera sp. UHCC 0190]